MLEGPMFEPAKTELFESSFRKTGAHYNIYAVRDDNGMDALRQIFPDGTADEMNFVLFSTSGVHGMYTSIEEVEEQWKNPTEDGSSDVTFLIIQPRIVCMRYGNCKPKNADDIAFLKKLRATSWKAVREIGKP